MLLPAAHEHCTYTNSVRGSPGEDVFAGVWVGRGSKLSEDHSLLRHGPDIRIRPDEPEQTDYTHPVSVNLKKGTQHLWFKTVNVVLEFRKNTLLILLSRQNYWRRMTDVCGRQLAEYCFCLRHIPVG